MMTDRDSGKEKGIMSVRQTGVKDLEDFLMVESRLKHLRSDRVPDYDKSHV